MGRTAVIVDRVLDVWGDYWDVREYRDAPGFALAIGWPAGRRGQGTGGPRVIVTPEALGYFARHRHRGGVKAMVAELPIGSGAVKRVRKMLGHHVYDDSTSWWLERTEDLLVLSGREFAAKHNRSEAAASMARQLLFGVRRCRARKWWLTEPAKSTLLSDYPAAVQADLLDVPAGSIRRLRAMVQRAIGVTDETIAARGRSRMKATKIGTPAHPNTAAALAKAAATPRKQVSRTWRHPARTLSTEDVVAAREMYAAGDATQHALADLLQLSVPTVASMLYGKTYRDAGGPLARPRRRKRNP